ncbi:MAG: sugar transferase [Lachnospiraceae bacterium]|nr:sugar transferase [Lachnospiraceae bacterium]
MKRIKSIVERFLAGIALLVLSPVMLFAAIGIKLSSQGPVFYKAKRMGKNLKPLTIYKFRTMYVGAEKEGAVTAVHDKRVFALGEVLRKTKIDELPQLINILNGTMSIIGPRPEDMDIVNKYYTREEKKTLTVLPGLACPGSIFNYTHGEQYLKDNNTEDAYVKEFLHIKLALDLYYLRHWSLFYDIRIIFRTIYAILVSTCTSRQIDFPLEYKKVFGENHIF